MQSLLENYSLSIIVIAIVGIIELIPKGMKGISYVYTTLKSFFGRDFADEQHDKEVDKQLNEIEKFYEEKQVVDDGFAKQEAAMAAMNDRMDNLIAAMNQRIEMLIESDKEDIKSYITKEHHYFCYEVGWIDDYNLECLERRFAVYQEEHGNSFVEGLMAEIRTLPKQAPTKEMDAKFERTSRYTQHQHKK